MDFNLALMKNYFTCKCIILITPLGIFFSFFVIEKCSNLKL